MSAIGIQVFTEARDQVTAHAIGGRVVVTIGNGGTQGVQLMGDIADVRQVVAEALDKLTELEGQ
jgi:hypothetical protein